MKNFLKKNKKYLGLILITVIVFNFAFLPLTASAKNHADLAGEAITWIAGETLLFISSTISALLGAVFGAVLWLEAQIIDYIINPKNFSFTKSSIVTLGWGITRDLANMFFILILLIIAFATVLKIQSYAIKQLWWKVLVAALLINFSLVIAGFVIDFTNVLTQFFLKQITGDGNFGTITTRLASSMQILNFYNPSQPEGGLTAGITQFGASAIAAAIGIILTLAGLVITVFVFGAAVIFLIVRILYIWFLLIIAPIVWMLWILPETSTYFSKWWNEFIKWTFFAPIYVFFIYLSLSIFDANGQLNTGVFPRGEGAWLRATPGLTTVGMPQAIFQWILVIAMMFGSLIVAQKFGVYGAAASQTMLKGWGEKSKGWAGRQLKRGYVGATKPEAPTPPPTGAGIGARLGYRFRQAGAAVGRGALMVPGLRERQLKYMGEEDKAYKAAYDEYKNLDPTLLNQVAAGVIVDPRSRLALQQVRMEKDLEKPGAGKFNDYLNQSKKYRQEPQFIKLATDKLGQEGWKTEAGKGGFDAAAINNLLNQAGRDPGLEQGLLKQISEKMKKDFTPANGYDDAARVNLLQKSQKYGAEKDFLKFFPNLAPAIGKNIKDTVSKIEKAADIYEDQLVANVVKELNLAQFKDIGKSGDYAQRGAVKRAIMQDYRLLSDRDRQSITRVSFEKNLRKREELRKSLPEDLRKMSYMREIITTPKWEQNI